MDFFIPKYRRNPNEKVDSLYYGVNPRGGLGAITRIRKVSLDGNRMETTQEAATGGLKRGEGGLAGILVLGGMETTLDEMEDIVQARKEKKFVPKRGPSEIAQMAHYLIERRNERIRYLRKNPSERPKKRPTKRLYLPMGFKYVPTSEPGLNVLSRV